jgi:hypothetical protein
MLKVRTYSSKLFRKIVFILGYPYLDFPKASTSLEYFLWLGKSC